MAKVNLNLKYRLELYDKKRKKVWEYEAESRSLLKNFIAWIRSGSILIAPYETVVDLNGNTKNVLLAGMFDVGDDNYLEVRNHLGAPDGDDSYGIMIGSGTASVSPDDYALESKIPHGEGSGQAYYHGTEIKAKEVSDNTTKFDIKRDFENRSGATLNVNEIGLAMWQRYRGDVTGNKHEVKFLIARDVLPSTKEFPDGYYLVVTYTIQVTA